jgi:hypothetical protein
VQLPREEEEDKVRVTRFATIFCFVARIRE